MSTISTPALIMYERSGRWAASLRRHGLVERLRLLETRSLAELEEHLNSNPQALVGLELSGPTLTRALGWLGGRPARLETKAVLVFADRGLRGYEWLVREAGAVDFISSELELFRIPALADRYLSDWSFGKLEQEPSITAQIRAKLPWGDSLEATVADREL